MMRLTENLCTWHVSLLRKYVQESTIFFPGVFFVQAH